MKSLLKIAAVLSLAASVSLQATPINYSAAVDGTTIAGATASASGGALVVDTKNGVTFLGVKGGLAGTEIDLGQSVSINFWTPQFFNSITFGLLFNGPEYGDLNEIAASLTNGTDEYSLHLTGENAAKWYKNGSWLSDVTGTGTIVNGFGLFTINNPFPSVGVTSLSLYPLSAPGPKSDSDFGLVAFSTPDGGMTAVLLGLGLMAIAAGRRYVSKR